MSVTTADIRARKGSGQKIVMLTAYDAPSARIVDAAGVDAILVGDSVGTNVLGFDSVTEVTLDHMLHHARAVARGARNALLIGDLPFMSYRISVEQALATSARMVQEGRMHAVKLEGGADIAPTVSALTDAGIPVLGHIGLIPQSAHQLGGLRAQGRNLEGARALLESAKALEDAGAFAVVLEAIPYRLAALITQRCAIPSIGIGAGLDCDGQIQVLNDIAGWNPDFLPKHAKRYGDIAGDLAKAVAAYAGEVRAGSFPKASYSFKIDADIIDRLEDLS